VRSLELAVKYLAGDRLIGTAAERAALTTGVPTYETDTFSGWSASGFASIGSNKVTLAVPTGTYNNNDAMDGVRYDIGTANFDDTWTLQFTVKPTVWSTNSTCDYQDGWIMVTSGIGLNYNYVIFALSNTTCNPSTSTRNEYSFALKQGAGFRGHIDTNTSGVQEFMPTITPINSGLTPVVDSKKGIRIRRTASNAFTFEIWNNSDFTGSANYTYSSSDTTLAADIEDLRYITIGGNTQSGGNGGNTSEIDDLKFWDGESNAVSLSYPNLTNGTLFEESDTGKHYMFDGTSTWNEIT